MTDNRIIQADIASLKIVKYPDPRLRKMSVELSGVDDSVRQLVDKMFELMFESKGVGLAAPQVGINMRLFIGSPTFEPSDRRVYINPKIISMEGTQDDDEGCLSFPNIHARVKRARRATIRALNLDGLEFEETGEDLLARLYQHETDHLDGTLLVDRMGSVAKLANRRSLKNLQEQFDG